MVDDITRLGELLRLPNLEEETITLINSKMREMIGDTKVMSAEQKDVLMQQAENLLGLWFNGPKKEGE